MFLGQHWPHRWCVVEVPTLGQQQYFNCWNFSVDPMLGQNSTPTMTCCITQRWPNYCLLSGVSLEVRRLTKVWLLPDWESPRLEKFSLCPGLSFGHQNSWGFPTIKILTISLISYRILLRAWPNDYGTSMGRELVLNWLDRENFVQQTQKWLQLSFIL